MWKNISRRNILLGLLAGASIVFAFVPFHVVPLIFLFPVFMNMIALDRLSFKAAFWYGFVISIVVNAGGFFWMVYTIHVFGYLPWSVSVLIFLVFCGFGALNVPLFVAVAAWIQRERDVLAFSPLLRSLWFVLGLPALFTVFEFTVPKLFPVYFGHCFYWIPWLTQIVELTGAPFLSFSVYSLGGLFDPFVSADLLGETPSACHFTAYAIPLLLWGADIAFSVQRLNAQPANDNNAQCGFYSGQHRLPVKGGGPTRNCG